MVAYHILFDIDYLGIAQIGIHTLPLLIFQRTIGALFLLLVGVSLTLSESGNKDGYRRHLRRGLALCAVALGITAATWVYPHEGFITFGIIHFIALATLIAPIFFRFGRRNVLLGLLLIAAGFFTAGLETDSPHLFWLGITAPGYAALDYYPLVPWFGVVLIGLFAGETFFPGGESRLRVPESALTGSLAWAGRHSLAIYLAHQPIIVGAMLAYKALAGM
ncbi:DUF1624 domain-containing protein [Candidatus Micrarchaeota archaeon]|nr:DUF1624 domain-containing protein [Candidatus Micrarchaeota archaeon]